MTAPTVLAGTKLLILVGNGASPEVFAAPCGLTTRSFDLSAATSSTNIPDCADEDAASWEARDVTSLAMSVSGSGVLATESFDVWNDWFLSAEPKNIQVKLDNAALGHYAGAFIISGFRVNGTRGNKITIDLTIVNNGTVTYVPAT